MPSRRPPDFAYQTVGARPRARQILNQVVLMIYSVAPVDFGNGSNNRRHNMTK